MAKQDFDVEPPEPDEVSNEPRDAKSAYREGLKLSALVAEQHAKLYRVAHASERAEGAEAVARALRAALADMEGA
jgi:hypothetical protein